MSEHHPEPSTGQRLRKRSAIRKGALRELVKNSTCFETGGLDADRGKPDHQQRMKIHARVEVLPGVPITQAWEVVKHRGTPHLLFSPADGDVAVLIHLDESKITILDKAYGLEAEITYTDCLKLSEAIAAKLY